MELCIWLTFVFLMSIAGAIVACVLNEKVIIRNISLLSGIAAGVMLATTIWSLLIPAFEYDQNNILIILSFLIGFVLLLIVEIAFEKNKFDCCIGENKTYFAITLHNIPEGLIIGVGFGVCAVTNATYGAVALALAIGIQNFPESLSLSILLKEKGKSNFKVFLLNFISAIVEPVFGIVGYFLSYNIMTMLGTVLGITAGMMLYVILSEVIIEALEENKTLGMIGVLLGFSVMTVLEKYL